MIKRQTARKVRISELINGRWVKMEGMEPSFIETAQGEKVSRARIMGTVVSRFVSEDGNFASVTLDDSTDTIRAKAFKEITVLEPVEIGDLVDMIGKVREYNEEIYVIPEVVKKVSDPNLELLRRADLLRKGVSASQSPAERAAVSADTEKEKKQGSLREDVLKLIESSGEGISYSEILEKMDAKEEDVESVINELLSEGVCYEPNPGKIRKI